MSGHETSGVPKLHNLLDPMNYLPRTNHEVQIDLADVIYISYAIALNMEIMRSGKRTLEEIIQSYRSDGR